MRSIAAGTSPAGATQGGEAVSPLIAATAQSLPEQAHALVRARAFAEPLLANETMETGENTLAHADAEVQAQLAAEKHLERANPSWPQYLDLRCGQLHAPGAAALSAGREFMIELLDRYRPLPAPLLSD